MSILMEPIAVAGMELPNRFVRSATHDSQSTATGEITDESVAFLSDLAKGGVGLLVLGFAYVTQKGQAVPNQTAIYDDRFIPGLRRVTESVHQYDTKVVLQVGDGGSQSMVAKERGYLPLAPSAVYKDWIVWRGSPAASQDGNASQAKWEFPENRSTPIPMEMAEMTIDDIHQTIAAYARAARRAKEAGFDGVQFHGGHGYLISQFASPVTNRRTDDWGGSLENRTRFIRECYSAARKEVGADYPLLIKMGVADQAKGGLTVEDGIKMAKLLADAGANAIEISEGVEMEPAHHIRAGMETGEKEPFYFDWARQVRKEVDIPLFLVGGLRTFSLMEQLVESGVVDCVSMCRPFIRDPDLVKQFSEGKIDKVGCISCNGCLKVAFTGKLACALKDSN